MIKSAKLTSNKKKIINSRDLKKAPIQSEYAPYKPKQKVVKIFLKYIKEYTCRTKSPHLSRL